MDEERGPVSGPKGRKAALFERAVRKNRRPEHAAGRQTEKSADKGGVREQQMRIKAAFAGADAG